ncbi:MAG: hypothetical protein ACFB2X_13825 [Rivularia sp. (in: cyanobacteria)]
MSLNFAFSHWTNYQVGDAIVAAFTQESKSRQGYVLSEKLELFRV